MSSHHIVRDNQEPALIIANGADCSDALLQQLMEWSPYVLALDVAVHRLLARKLRFDDHTFNNMATLCRYHDQITLSILDDHSRVYPLGKQFKKWYPAGTQLSLIPVGYADGIHSKNLQYPLENHRLELPYSTGSSNQVLEDGFVEITYAEGHLLMMECFD